MTEQDLDWLGDIAASERDILGRGVSIAESIVRDAQSARACWSLWEAINTRLSGEQLQQALAWHAPSGLGVIRQSLAECTILAVMRMTDDAGSDDRLSACQLAGVLANDAIREVLVGPAWVSRGATTSCNGIAGFEVAAQPKRIKWFRERVPLGWGRGDRSPDIDALVRVRDSLRGIRNRRIAHSLSGDFDAPQIDQIRRGLQLASEIARTASLIFLGNKSGLDNAIENLVLESDDVWTYFESGLVAAHRSWAAEVQRTTRADQR